MLRALAKRLLLLPAALAVSCLLAGLYGALHNQVSFTVAPAYFYEFKFLQFGLPADLHNRLGALIVGVRASWWMGGLIGTPIYLLCLFVPGFPAFMLTYVFAAVVVVVTAFATGLLALLYGWLTFKPDHLPAFMQSWQVSDPVAFAIAGNMHNFSYLGAGIGLTLGAVIVICRAIRARREGRGP